MKTIRQAILFLCLILLWNHTPTNAEETKKSNCGFSEAMILIDKYSGNRDVLDKASGCLGNMATDSSLTYLVNGRILVKSGYLSSGQFSENAINAAEKYYQKAIKLAPDNYEVNYYAALFYGTAANGKQEILAQRHLKKISDTPFNSERTLYLKMILLPDGNLEKEKLAHHFAESPVFSHKNSALTILKEIYWKTDHDLVEIAYKEIFKNGKKHNVNLAWDYLDYAGFLTYQKREFDKAAEMMDISRSYMKFGMQDIYDAEIAYRRGYQYVWKTNPRDYGKAIPLMEESIQLNSKHKYAYYNLAIAYYYHGMDTENKELIYKAKEYMLISQKQSPSYGEIKKNMAKINNTISQIERQ